MTEFIQKEIQGGTFELLIDSSIFSSDIVLRAAYNFLDRGYCFFRLNEEGNTIFQFTLKEGVNQSLDAIIAEYSDELLNVYLRNKLEKENKTIRETIVGSAIANSLDASHFVSIDTDQKGRAPQIDFDKDIDEILKEIENDPDLKIDEAEIDRILQEIENETGVTTLTKESNITLDLNSIQDAKKKFQSGASIL